MIKSIKWMGNTHWVWIDGISVNTASLLGALLCDANKNNNDGVSGWQRYNFQKV